MWSGQHQQSTKPRIPQQLASIIMPKENVVFYLKLQTVISLFLFAGSCQYYSIYKVFFFFFEKVVFTKLKWEIKYLQVTVTNGPVSVTEKGPAHSSAMGTHWGWCFFFPYAVFCGLGRSGDLIRPTALICCVLHCCLSKQVLFSLSVPFYLQLQRARNFSK